MAIIVPNFLLKWIERKASKVSKILIAPGTKGAVWSSDDYETIAKESYLKNTISFACIFEIAKNASSVPWKVFRRLPNDKREPNEDHYLNDLLKHPNPDDSFNFLVFKIAAFLAMDGNSYLEKVTPSYGRNKEIPKELYVHRPDRITIHVNPTTGQLDYYEYKVEGRNVTWRVDPVTHDCDILHFKLFHPLNDWYGYSPTKSIAREIDSFNEGTEWNMKLLQNEGRPGMIVKLIGHLTDTQYEDYKRKLKEEFSGATGAGRTMLLTGERGTDATPYGWSPHELDNLEGGRELARKIAIGYNVPPILLQIPGDSTFSNQKEARQAFWETTMFFYLQYMKNELNNWFFPKGSKDENLFLDYILDEIPALAPRRDLVWQRCQKSDFLTVNEKREMIGMPSLGKAGDVILVSSANIRLEDVGMNYENVDREEENEDEKIIRRLVELGNTREEAEMLIGYHGNNGSNGGGDNNVQ